jgi:hypothetical protein
MCLIQLFVVFRSGVLDDLRTRFAEHPIAFDCRRPGLVERNGI